MTQILYTIDDYQEVHRQVLDYQSGKPGSANKLIKSFSDFIWKYTNFITHGVYKLEDYSVRRFLSLYISESSIKKCSAQYKFKPSVKEHMREVAKMIRSLFAQYKEVEIRNELICVLLTMAKKYKDTERPSFHNYVDKCFHYEAFRGLEHLISDPLARLTYEEFIDNMSADYSIDDEFTKALEEVRYEMAIKDAAIPVEHVEVSPFDSDSLNVNWVNGVTCSELFKELTPFERKLLIMRYVDGLTDTEIADKLGLCRATINRRRLKAKEKLEGLVKADKKTISNVI